MAKWQVCSTATANPSSQILFRTLTRTAPSGRCFGRFALFKITSRQFSTKRAPLHLHRNLRHTQSVLSSKKSVSFTNKEFSQDRSPPPSESRGRPSVVTFENWRSSKFRRARSRSPPDCSAADACFPARFSFSPRRRTFLVSNVITSQELARDNRVAAGAVLCFGSVCGYSRVD